MKTPSLRDIKITYFRFHHKLGHHVECASGFMVKRKDVRKLERRITELDAELAIAKHRNAVLTEAVGLVNEWIGYKQEEIALSNDDPLRVNLQDMVDEIKFTVSGVCNG